MEEGIPEGLADGGRGEAAQGHRMLGMDMRGARCCQTRTRCGGRSHQMEPGAGLISEQFVHPRKVSPGRARGWLRIFQNQRQTWSGHTEQHWAQNETRSAAHTTD